MSLKKQQEEIAKLLERVSGKQQEQKPKAQRQVEKSPVAKKEEKGKIKEEKPGPAAPVVAPAAGVKQRPWAQEKNEDK